MTVALTSKLYDVHFISVVRWGKQDKIRLSKLVT